MLNNISNTICIRKCQFTIEKLHGRNKNQFGNENLKKNVTSQKITNCFAFLWLIGRESFEKEIFRWYFYILYMDTAICLYTNRKHSSQSTRVPPTGILLLINVRSVCTGVKDLHNLNGKKKKIAFGWAKFSFHWSTTSINVILTNELPSFTVQLFLERTKIIDFPHFVFPLQVTHPDG